VSLINLKSCCISNSVPLLNSISAVPVIVVSNSILDLTALYICNLVVFVVTNGAVVPIPILPL
jgi:hypothetical protein